MACPVCRCTETYIYCDGEDYDLGDELIRCAACGAIFEAEDEAQEDEYEDDAIAEAVAEASCSMGVGCGTAGVCYAEVNGMPDMCARVKPNAGVTGAEPEAERPLPLCWASRRSATTDFEKEMTMVDVVEQLCIKSFEITAQNGDHWRAEQGKSYTTTVPSDEEETVTVFSDFWVQVPKEHFVLLEKKAKW